MDMASETESSLSNKVANLISFFSTHIITDRFQDGGNEITMSLNQLIFSMLADDIILLEGNQEAVVDLLQDTFMVCQGDQACEDIEVLAEKILALCKRS